MLAAIAKKDYAAVRDIDETLGKHVTAGPLALSYRAYLIAFAERRLHDATSVAGPSP
jgi:hypothetical protein